MNEVFQLPTVIQNITVVQSILSLLDTGSDTNKLKEYKPHTIGNSESFMALRNCRQRESVRKWSSFGQ